MPAGEQPVNAVSDDKGAMSGKGGTTKKSAGLGNGHQQGCRPAVMWFPRSIEPPPVVHRVELNVLWWVVMALAFAVRFWRLDYPCYVV